MRILFAFLFCVSPVFAGGIVRTNHQFGSDFYQSSFEVTADVVLRHHHPNGTGGVPINGELNWVTGPDGSSVTITADDLIFEDEPFFKFDQRYAPGSYGMLEWIGAADGSSYPEGWLPGSPMNYTGPWAQSDAAEYYGQGQLELTFIDGVNFQVPAAYAGRNSIQINGWGRFENEFGEYLTLKIDRQSLEVVAVPEPAASDLLVTIAIVFAMVGTIGWRTRA